MLRGFTREVLAIASWAAAAAAAYYFYPVVISLPRALYSQGRSSPQAAAAAIVFFATLIVVSLFTVRLSDAILDSKIGALDRTLGFVFGVARGLPARGRRVRDLQLAGLGQAATGMGQNRQDAPGPDRNRGQDRGHAAGGRGGDHRRLDQVQGERRAGERGAGGRIDRSDDRADRAAAAAPARTRRRKRTRATPRRPIDKQKLDALINGASASAGPKQ